MFIIGIILNLSLLIAISIIAVFIDNKWSRHTIKGSVILGIMFGITTILGMLKPYVFISGIYFDGRSVVLSLNALFFGPISAIIAAVISTIYRIYLGGSGVYMGVSVIFTSTLIGLFYYYRKTKKLAKVNNINLLALGLQVHIVMLLLMIFLPSNVRLTALKELSFSILFFFPLATVLIGRIYIDQDENIRLVKELSESEEKYRLLVENQTDLIVKLDKEGRFIFVSKSFCNTFNKSEAELLGKEFREIFGESINKEEFDVLKSIFKPPHQAFYEQKIFIGNEYSWYDWVYKAILDKNGEVYEIVGVGRDITEKKKYELEIKKLNETLEEKVKERTKELQLSNDELEAFSYSVSHDLRAPLRAIQGFSNIIFEDYSDKCDKEVLELVKSIIKNSQKMDELITSLLRLSKITKTNLKVAECNMENLVNNVINEIKSTYNNGTEIVLNKIPSAKVDSSLIYQVWLNLIGNAVKFSGKVSNPKVEINGYSDKNFHYYTISDNGEGFDEKYKEKLFKVFQRLHSQTSFEGTGVGLAIVKRIIEKHGGEVWAENNISGGATFGFSLPV